MGMRLPPRIKSWILITLGAATAIWCIKLKQDQIAFDNRLYPYYDEYECPFIRESFIIVQPKEHLLDDPFDPEVLVAVHTLEGSLVLLKNRFIPTGPDSPRWSKDGTVLVIKDSTELMPGDSYPPTHGGFYTFAYDFLRHKEISPPGTLAARSRIIASFVNTRGGIGHVAKSTRISIPLSEQPMYFSLWKRLSSN